MLIFLDTEFTSLSQSDSKLLSLALVPADGRNHFYAEIAMGEDSWNFWDCSDFVMTDVLPLMKGGDCLMSNADLRARLVEWFATMPRSVRVACDSEIDFRFLQAILTDAWPKNLEKRYFDLRPMVDTTVYDQAVYGYYAPGRYAHNALNDAQAYRIGWLAWADANKEALSALEKSKQMHRDWKPKC